MTTTNCLCDSGSGGLYGASTTYATSGTTCTALYTGDKYYVGQAMSGSTYYRYRAFLKFNTSVIPDGDTITQVNMKMVALENNSDVDFDLVIKKADWSAYDPASNDNKESIWDLILSASSDDNIWKNSADVSINTQYASGNLSTTWVNKAGYTYYGLISSRDISGNAPAAPQNPENLRIGAEEYATETYRPILTVIHNAPSTFVPKTIMFFGRELNWSWWKKDGIWQPKNPGLITA